MINHHYRLGLGRGAAFKEITESVLFLQDVVRRNVKCEYDIKLEAQIAEEERLWNEREILEVRVIITTFN